MPLRSLDALTMLGLECNRLASLHGALNASLAFGQQATHGLVYLQKLCARPKQSKPSMLRNQHGMLHE